MAANIEQIFQDFILNKIREIEDQQEDNGPVKTLATESQASVKMKPASDGDEQEADCQGAALKKHKKHKKHKSKKSKKKKKKRDREEKETSSESGLESEGRSKHRSSRTPGEEGRDGEGKRKLSRHKQHLMGRKKKRKRRKEDGRSSSDSQSEGSQKGGSRGPASSSSRKEDLPDIIPKEDSSKKGGADSQEGGGRSQTSRSRAATHSRSRSRLRGRRSRSRTRSRSRRAKSKSTSRSRSQLAVRCRKTKSRSKSPKTWRSGSLSVSAVRVSGPPADPAATETQPPDSRLPGIEPQLTDPVVDTLALTDPPGPPPDPSPAAAVAVKAAGSWKPLPPLEVVTPASLPQKAVPTRPPPPEVAASEPAAPLPVPGEEGCGVAAEDPAHPEPRSADPGPDASAEGEAAALPKDPGPASPGPCDVKSSPVPPDAADPKSPCPPEKPDATATVADGNESSSKSSAQSRRPSSKSPQKKKARSDSRSRRRSSRSGSRAGRKRSGSRRKRSGSRRKRSGSRRKRSGSRRRRSGSRRRRSGSRSRKKSRSRSPARRPKRSRSGSQRRGGGGYGGAFSQRDRWKREPSRSPVLILRKNRSPAPKAGGKSPPRITELDKEQLLEIAKANAAAMCTKAGVPIPDSLKPRLNSQIQLPMAMPMPNMAMNAAVASMAAATMTAALSSMGALASMPPLPSITNKPPPGAPQMDMAALEVVKKKVTKQANSISIKEFTDKCKMIVDSKGELPVAQPHVSDEEDEGKPFGSAGLREQRAISFSINNMSVRPAARSDAGIAKEFPVSSGSQHRKKEGEAPGAYGEWVAVEKMSEKAAKAAAAAVAAAVKAAAAADPSSPRETAPETQPQAPAPADATQASAAPASDSVFPEPPLQPVDISQAVIERIKAQRRLAENPYDVSAISMLSRAQEQVDAWAQSNTIPGLFTGSTGATVLTSEELSNSGPQAWLKKDQFLRAAPVSGGVGEFLMRKMGWRTGEGLGRNREGTVEPIIIDFKIDRKGLVANGEKPQKQTGGLVVTKDLMGKHPVSALIELCNKRHMAQPDFVMVHHSGPDHRKNFLFKVTVNSVDYQPQTASPNKKHAKAMAAMVALQGLGEVPADGPGLYTGPVFTAASTGPLFST